MQLWRINLKPDSKLGIEAAEFCVKRGVVGIGWGIGGDPKTKEDYWKAAEPAHTTDYKHSWPKAANAILYRMQIGDLVWTRDPKGSVCKFGHERVTVQSCNSAMPTGACRYLRR